MTEVQGLEQESKLSDELDQYLNGICSRMAVTSKRTERVRSSTRQQNGFVPESLQPTGRQSAIPSKQRWPQTRHLRLCSKKQQTAFHEVPFSCSKEHPPVPDGWWHIQGYSSSQNCWYKELQAQGKGQGCQSRKWSSRYKLHVMVLGMTGQDSA